MPRGSSGLHPLQNHLGDPWQEGSEAERLAGTSFGATYKALLWILVGDLDWFGNYLHVKPHFNSTSPCWLCQANDTSIPWTDFGDEAIWRTTLHPPDIERHISDVAFFDLPGISGANICIDVLHTMCLGVSAHATGSVLADIIEPRLPGTTMSQRLERLWDRIRDLYVQFSSTNRLNNLRLTMIQKAGKFSELSARAAEIRGLVPVLEEICKQELDRTPCLANAHRYQVMSNLSSVYSILDRNGFQIEEQDMAALRLHIQRCARHFRVLARTATAEGKLRWQLTVKMHVFLHLVDQAKYLNPRYGWTYQYENFVQKMLRVSRACAAGTPPHKTGLSIMNKYRSVLSVRFRR